MTVADAVRNDFLGLSQTIYSDIRQFTELSSSQGNAHGDTTVTARHGTARLLPKSEGHRDERSFVSSPVKSRSNDYGKGLSTDDTNKWPMTKSATSDNSPGSPNKAKPENSADSTLERDKRKDVFSMAFGIDSDIRELKSYLSSYKMEISHGNTGFRNSSNNELKQMISTFEDIQKTWLLTLRSTEGETKNTEESSRIPCSVMRAAENAVARLDRNNSQLVDMKGLVLEADKLGTDTLRELHKQREVMEKVKANTERLNKGMTENSSIVDRLHKWWHDLI